MNSRYSMGAFWLFVMMLQGCSHNREISHGGWSFSEPRSELCYDNSPLPNTLSKSGISLVTPLGTFRPTTSERWGRISCQMPLPDPHRTWVATTISQPVSCTEDMKQVGFYRTDSLPIYTGSWQDTQLSETPVSWVYAFKRANGKEFGYWIDPKKLNSVDWSRIEVVESIPTGRDRR